MTMTDNVGLKVETVPPFGGAVAKGADGRTATRKDQLGLK
jgi:hypothetical protein